MILYARTNNLKDDLNANGATGSDDRLVESIAEATRAFRSQSNRDFHPTIETRYFDGDGGTSLWVNDLLSITSLKFDFDGDRTYEETTAATDYWLWPDNKTPYRRIDLDPEGTYSALPVGRRRIQIVGVWGYSNTKLTIVGTAAVTATVATTSGLTVTASETVASLIFPGDMLVLEDEDLGEVTSVANTSIVVRERAVNGTTAAAHSGKQLYVRVAPDDVARAVRADAARYWWRMSQGLPSDGSFREMWPAIADCVNHYTDPAAVI